MCIDQYFCTNDLRIDVCNRGVPAAEMSNVFGETPHSGVLAFPTLILVRRQHLLPRFYSFVAQVLIALYMVGQSRKDLDYIVLVRVRLSPLSVSKVTLLSRRLAAGRVPCRVLDRDQSNVFVFFVCVPALSNNNAVNIKGNLWLALLYESTMLQPQ